MTLEAFPTLHAIRLSIFHSHFIIWEPYFSDAFSILTIVIHILRIISFCICLAYSITCI